MFTRELQLGAWSCILIWGLESSAKATISLLVLYADFRLNKAADKIFFINYITVDCKWSEVHRNPCSGARWEGLHTIQREAPQDLWEHQKSWERKKENQEQQF